ncbi:wall-associated receptor kinase [Trifolium repens]|nr:wall-associated receptor kinase [Trifolium repens]
METTNSDGVSDSHSLYIIEGRGEVPAKRKNSFREGTVTDISAFGALGIGGGIWHLKKVRATTPVTCRVQTNENRLF